MFSLKSSKPGISNCYGLFITSGKMYFSQKIPKYPEGLTCSLKKTMTSGNKNLSPCILNYSAKAKIPMKMSASARKKEQILLRTPLSCCSDDSELAGNLNKTLGTNKESDDEDSDSYA